MHQGDVIVFPHGDAHVVSSTPGLRAEPDIDFYYQSRPPQLPFILNQSTGGTNSPKVLNTFQTNLLCGFFGCDSRPFNPLLASLPKMIHMRASDMNSDNWVVHFTRLAKSESTGKRPGGEAVLERMSEMMFIDILRAYLEKLPDDQCGWLAGLRDRYIGRVLSLMHEQPAKNWTLEQLSSGVGLSRSAFHERFVRFLGLTPIQYLSNWRMQIASRLLTQSNATIASVAFESGYDSEAAFSRAFKRLLGMPPSVWRRQREAAVANIKDFVSVTD
jgi:AraC-like DNA-binding protein